MKEKLTVVTLHCGDTFSNGTVGITGVCGDSKPLRAEVGASILSNGKRAVKCVALCLLVSSSPGVPSRNTQAEWPLENRSADAYFSRSGG